MSDWYYLFENKAKGPYKEAELRKLLAEYEITGTTLVWREGLEDWAGASELPEFAPPERPS